MVIKLKTVRLVDLTLLVGDIAPKDLPDLKSIRKISGAMEVLEKATKPYMDKLQAIKLELQELAKPYAEKLKALEAKKDPKSEAEKKKLIEEGNKLVAPLNEKMLKLEQSEGQVEIEVSMDENYLSEVKEQFKKAKDKFTNMKAFIELADALGIQE
jgi:hypothetical protein